jgi:hypothetical protein
LKGYSLNNGFYNLDLNQTIAFIGGARAIHYVTVQTTSAFDPKDPHKIIVTVTIKWLAETSVVLGVRIKRLSFGTYAIWTGQPVEIGSTTKTFTFKGG